MRGNAAAKEIVMNRWIMLVLALLLALLSACTPYVYGIPKPTWDTMSEPERLEAMRIYKERQIANRLAMEERARRNAIERAKQQARAAEAERLRQERLRQERSAPQPQVVIVHQPAPPPPKPQVIIIKEERPRHRQPQVIVVRDEKPQPPSPQAIVAKDEHPRNHRQPQPPGVKEEKPQPQVVVVKEAKPTPQQRNEAPLTPPVSPQTPPAVTPVREIPQERKQPAAAPPVEIKAPGRVDVSFVAGQMKIKGKHQPIEPITIRLNEGETLEVSLKTPDGAHPVTVSYRNGTVAIDADPATGRGKSTAARLPFEKDWKAGRLYRIETKGRLSLEAAEIRIVAADGN